MGILRDHAGEGKVCVQSSVQSIPPEFCSVSAANLGSRVFVPFDQRSENEGSSSNHFEIIEYCPSGFTTHSQIFFICGVRLKWLLPTIGQGERGLRERDSFCSTKLLGIFLLNLKPFKAIPFFFRLLSNTFSDFGSVGRKKKKKQQK